MSVPTHDCTNCGGSVKARRASTTGEHYCKLPDCQAARQRAFRARVRARAGASERGEEYDLHEQLRKFFDAALNKPRVACGCGLRNAVIGYMHRSAPGAQTACFMSGNGGQDLGGKWLDLANPELVRSRPEYIGDDPR